METIWLEQLCDKLCHLIPERKLVLGGLPTVLCSRCIGLYNGIMAMTCLWLLTRGKKREFTPGSKTVYIAIAMIMIIVVDALSSGYGYHQTNSAIRFITGIIGGHGSVIIAIYILQRVRWLKKIRPGWDYHPRYLPIYITTVVLYTLWALYGGKWTWEIVDLFAILGVFCHIFILAMVLFAALIQLCIILQRLFIKFFNQ